MSDDRVVTHLSREFLHGHPDRLAAELAGGDWGVVSTRELIGCGFTHRQIEVRVRNGQLHRLYRGSYCVGHGNPPWQGRLLAAVKACGPGAVSGYFSGLALWGVLDYDPDRYPDVVVAGSGGGRRQGVRVHRTAELDPRDRRRAQQVPVTSPARTLLDVASLTDEKALRGLVRRAQGLGVVSHRQLLEVMARLGKRHGSNRLAQALANGPEPTRSVLEDLVLDALLAAGFESPDVNKPLHVGGRTIVPDFRWPAQRLIVEADGRAWHDGADARAADRERQALLEASGERVFRVTWRQILTQRRATLTRLASAGAPRIPAA